MSVMRMWPLVGLSALASAIGPAANTQDPCSLLSADEAKAYVGTLASPPFRASDGTGTPNATGGVCVYRGADSRVLTVQPDWTGGFQTDATLKGPWDRAALVHGTQLIAVRHDVFVGMDLQSADYQKAKALMVAICSRL